MYKKYRKGELRHGIVIIIHYLHRSGNIQRYKAQLLFANGTNEF